MTEPWNKTNCPLTVVKKFWSQVKLPKDLKNNCWVWTGTRHVHPTHDYGIFHYDGKRVRAHRFSYECYNGYFDKKLFVCHKCDNPGCINPNHLFLGTHADNMKDMSDKGRAPIGERCGTSKLTEIEVKQILTDLSLNKYKTILEVTNKHDIGSMQIIRILQGKSWKHISKDFDINNIRRVLKSTQNSGENNPRAILNEDKVRDIRKRLSEGQTGVSIARLYGVGKGRISDIKNFKTWKTVI